MNFVFTTAEAGSVAWGDGGIWVVQDEAWFADDPFVRDHPELFSAIPPRVRSTTGRQVEQAPLAAAAPLRKGRGNG